jgi:hypothetical protein
MVVTGGEDGSSLETDQTLDTDGNQHGGAFGGTDGSGVLFKVTPWSSTAAIDFSRAQRPPAVQCPVRSTTKALHPASSDAIARFRVSTRRNERNA